MLNLDEIKSGDIGLCRGNKWLAKAIMKMTGSKWSHACIFIWHEGVLMVVDAQKDGFNMRTYDNWKKDYGYQFVVFRSNKRDLLIVNRIQSIIGTTPYDFESLLIRQPRKIVSMILNRFRKEKIDPWKDRGDNENERMYCSEAVAYCLNIDQAERMSPEDLYKYAIENNFLEIGKNF